MNQEIITLLELAYIHCQTEISNSEEMAPAEFEAVSYELEIIERLINELQASQETGVWIEFFIYKIKITFSGSQFCRLIFVFL